MRDDDTDERDDRTDEKPLPEPRDSEFDDEPKSGTFRIPRI